MYEIDGDYLINSCIKAASDKVDHLKFERLKRKLNKQEAYIRKHFASKKEIRRNLNILKLVSFLVPLLIGLKRRMKIPDLNNLLPFMSGDDVRTERELPPLLIPPEFKCKTFNFDKAKSNDENDKYFHLHGGIQFELETMPINQQCARYLYRISFIPLAPSQFYFISITFKVTMNPFLRSFKRNYLMSLQTI